MKKAFIGKNGIFFFTLKQSPSALSDAQKIEIDKQNQIVQENCEDFGLEYPTGGTQTISRDKFGNILIINSRKKRTQSGCQLYRISCYALGINCEDNSLCLEYVGELDCNREYYQHMTAKRPNCLHIKRLVVLDSFQSHGIGSILLQEAENIASSLNLKFMTLHSRKDYQFIDSAEASSAKNERNYQILTKKPRTNEDYAYLESEEFIDYLKQNFYDKNLRFYTERGFTRARTTDEYYGITTRSMVKRNPKYVSTKYGLDKPCKIKSKRDPAFSIAIEQSNDLMIDATIHKYAPAMFEYSANNVKIADFSPLPFGFDELSTKTLIALFNSLPKTIYDPFKYAYLQQSDFCLNLDSKKNYSKYSSSNEFKTILSKILVEDQPGEE